MEIVPDTDFFGWMCTLAFLVALGGYVFYRTRNDERGPWEKQ